ncbi:MAG: DUF1028 domain-containing protein [Pseudomonadota bacterium]
MTFSIVARDEATGAFGVAVASRFFAVGALVPHFAAKGAVATQAFVNPMWGVEGSAMLAKGAAAAEIVANLVERDAGAPQRQCHLVDAGGGTAAHTGANCVDWAGHASAENVSVAGNMLAGPAVIEETLSCWLDNPELEMPDRLLAALRAGEAAGGDKRGRQAAAIVIHRGQPYPMLDLRVDDHADPLAELERLLAVARERFVHFAACMGTAERFEGVTDRTELDRILDALEQERAANGTRSASAASP